MSRTCLDWKEYETNYEKMLFFKYPLVSNIIDDAHPKVNGGLFGDNRGEQVLESERQKHEDNKVGPMENIAFQEHND